MSRLTAPTSQPEASAEGEKAQPRPTAADPALTEAFVAHRGYLKKYLASRLAPGQDAEDYAQEVYIRALGFARRENIVGSWRGILTRIAADLVVDGFRRRQARAGDRHVPLDSIADPSDDGVNSPERILQGREKIRDVEQTLASLDPDCRRAFELVRLHGRSYAQAARELGTDSVRIGRLIERAALHLAKAAINAR
jgi:RNA polymerase sigma-70 factor (ECF subfamily)